MDHDLLARAAALAVRAHGDQRYGSHPYTHHLVAVGDNLRRFGVGTSDLAAAAWLHDVVEDTAVPLDEVHEAFGERIAALVFAVTSEPGATRTDRNAATYAKIASTPAATLLKLADRIANVESCWSSRSVKLFMYRDEHPGFRAALRREDDPPSLAMWAHLDGLLGF